MGQWTPWGASGPLIQTAVGQVREAASSLQDIRGEAEHAVDRMARLVQGTEEQARRFQILRRTIEDASEVSERSEQSVRLNATTVTELEQTAQTLIDEARRFAVDESAAHSLTAANGPAGGLIPWVSALELGMPERDAQHRRLVDIVNRPHRAVSQGVGGAESSSLMDELMDYTRHHFRAEEELLERLGFSDPDAHRQAHGAFAAEAQDLAERARRGEPGVATDLMALLRDWLVQHIMVANRMVANRRYARELGISEVH